MGSAGGRSVAFSRANTGGSVGGLMIPELDEDLVKHSASVNSAQFYDLLKEHRNFMGQQGELPDAPHRQ